MPLVQKNQGSVNLNASLVTSLPSATTAGNSIFIFVQASGTITTPAGFTSRAPQVNFAAFYFFEKLVASGNATDTPTLTMSGAYNGTWQIVEYSGVTATAGTATGNNSTFQGNGAKATPNITPTSGNRLLLAFVGAMGDPATTTFTAGQPSVWTNSFTSQHSILRTGGAGSGNDTLASGWADRFVTANGSTAYSTAATFTAASNALHPSSIIAAYAHTASGSPYTMAAVTGTLTLSGQANRLARSRKMLSVNGTLTLAGPVVNLIYSGAGPKTMPAGIGFPRIDGQAVTLRRTRVMPAVFGTLTLSGQVSDLDADRRPAGGLGILTLAGQTNRLAYARKPAAGKGQLTLAGPVVNLIYSGAGAKVLPAGIGFPVLAGRPAVLRYSRVMLAADSLMRFVSQSVNLSYVPAVDIDIVMPVSAGVLRMAAQSAALDVRRVPPKPMELKFGRKVYLRRW